MAAKPDGRAGRAPFGSLVAGPSRAWTTLGGMRRAVLLAALLLAGCGGGDGGGASPATRGPAAAAERWPAPSRYVLDAAYDGDRLTGRERIAFANTGPRPLDRVWLRLWGNAFGGCGRRHVEAEVTAGGRAGEERQGCTALEVVLDRPLAPGARTTLELRLAVTPPTRPDRFGRYAGAAYFGNALPVLAVADEDGWHLPAYTFKGESFYSLSAAWDVTLRLPAGLRAAITGTERASAPGTVRSTAAHARDAMIVAGPLQETTRRAGSVTLRRWSLPGGEGAGAARRALALAAKSITGYERRLGPYGRDELDLVEGPRAYARGAGLGMEYPELVLTPARARILFHEVAHQWFYGIVGNDEWAEPWLDEGLATYAQYRLVGYRPRCAGRPSSPPLTATVAQLERTPARIFPVLYDGGACALGVLERGLGRARVDALLRDVVRAHRDGILTTAAFAAAVADAAPDGTDTAALLRRAGILPAAG